jgi:hypothetical protein
VLRLLVWLAASVAFMVAGVVAFVIGVNAGAAVRPAEPVVVQQIGDRP